MRILIFKLSPLGDTVMFLPVVQALRREHPDWRLTVVTTPLTAELYKGWIEDRDLIVEERSRLQKSWRRPWALLRRIGQLRGHDAALLSFDQSSVARMLATASGARVRVGGTGSVVRFQGGLTHQVPFPEGQSVAAWEWDMMQAMVGALGERIVGELRAPELMGITRRVRGGAAGPSAAGSNAEAAQGPAFAKPAAGRRAAPPRQRILIHPGASREYMRWGAERFAELARRLAVDFEVETIDRPLETVRALIERVAEADLYVGNHSGVFHLAAALGTPSVVMTSSAPYSSDPPWHRDRIRILRAPGLACQPCDKLTVSMDRCTNVASPMACMNHWTPAAVEAVCRNILLRSPTQAAS